MPPADPLPPVGYAWWVPTVGVVLVLAVAAWFAWVAWSTSRRRGEDLARGAAREQLLAEVDGAYERYRAGVLDVRGLHLELAALLRAYASERAGADVRSWTASRIGADGRLAPVGELLAAWEEPSFAPRSEAAAEEAAGRAREVISRW